MKPIHRHSLPLSVERGSDQTLSLELIDDAGVAASVSAASLVLKNGLTVLLTAADAEDGGVATYDLDGSTSTPWGLTEDLFAVWTVTVDGVQYTYKQTGSVCIWAYAPTLTAQDIYVRYPGLRQSFSVQEVTDMLSSTSGELERRLIGKGRRPFLIMDRWALADVHLDLCLSRLLSSADTTLNDERFRTASVAHMKAYEEGFGRLNFRYDFSESGDVAVAEPAEAVTPLVLTGARQGSFWW